MPNPTGTDTEREWFEIFNQTPLTIDLTGYKVGDEETQGSTEGMYSFPSGTMMPSGEVYVIALKATGFEAFYGFKPDFELTSSDPLVPDLTQYLTWGSGILALGNSGDHALIVSPADTIVDGVNHGDATLFFTGVLLGDNQSYERIVQPDTDTAADWTVRDSGSATPGFTTLTVIPEPSALALGLLAASLLVIRRRV